MRLGIYLPLFEDFSDPRRAADLAATAEEAGWAGLFVWDHIWPGRCRWARRGPRWPPSR